MTRSLQAARWKWLSCRVAVWALLLTAPAHPAKAADDSLDLSTLERIEVQPERLQLHSPRDQALSLIHI